MQKLIEQIVKEIVSGAGELDPVRRRMFLIWLGNHTSQVRCAGEESYVECLTKRLTTWLNMTFPLYSRDIIQEVCIPMWTVKAS